jgi:hypothetical protein
MGYSTDFGGSFQLSRQATTVEEDFLDKLVETRRMKRDVNKLMEMFKGEYGYPFAEDKTDPNQVYGYMGEYFVGGGGSMGQDHDDSIIDYNSASGNIGWQDYKGDWALKQEMEDQLNKDSLKQPGLWLQWELSSDGTELGWDGNEKFYHYIEWLQYLIQHFFEKWGIKLNGEVQWQGEDSSDFGKIIVTDNVVEILNGERNYVKRGN